MWCLEQGGPFLHLCLGVGSFLQTQLRVSRHVPSGPGGRLLDTSWLRGFQCCHRSIQLWHLRTHMLFLLPSCKRHYSSFELWCILIWHFSLQSVRRLQSAVTLKNTRELCILRYNGPRRPRLQLSTSFQTVQCFPC